MAVLKLAFVVLFLLRVRLRGFNSFHSLIRGRYGGDLLTTCRSLEKITKRLRKAELDLDFLLYCRLNQVIPNFVKFKLYKSSLYNTPFYDEATKKLLDMEIICKQKIVNKLTEQANSLFTNVTSKLSLIDSFIFKFLFNKCMQEFVSLVQGTHEKKLSKLGIGIPNFSNDNKTVFNLSDYLLTKREEFLLSLGLDFGLPCFKPSYNQFYGSLESIFSRLLKLQLCNDVVGLRTQMQVLAQKTYNNLKTGWAPFFSRKDLDVLKSLSKREELVISKPDKGKGTVILNKKDYIEKVERILADENKFRKIGVPDFPSIFKIEDRINRFLKEMKDNGIICNETYKTLYSTGGSYGVMYGLPKIHKEGTPIRPILASYDTPNYKLAKFLVPLLAPLTQNNYSIRNSEHFKERILPQFSDLYMISLDVESLFTNVPVDETIQIILDKLFTDPDTVFNDFNRTDFKKLLQLAVQDTAFIFNGKAYIQKDGMAMGSPLGPTFANIFMCSLEERMLDECPLAIHPFFYGRFVDDTFLLFRSNEQAVAFHDYANKMHQNITFTSEHEEDNKLPFLDTLISRHEDGFSTTVYRKKTFTGLGTNFYSNCFYNFKLNALSTLFHRAFTLTSDWSSFHNEIMYLHQYFLNNCYPSKLFYKRLHRFLNNVFIPKFKLPTVPKLSLYAGVPLINDNNFYHDIYKLINKYIPAVDIKLIPTNPLTIGSLFHLKEKLDPLMTSGIVYLFNCPKCNMGKYVGSSRRLLKVRISSHRGVSYRNGIKLKNPEFSNIRIHAKKCKYNIKYEDFRIIGRAKNEHQLHIFESLSIKQIVPSLNAQTTSSPLYLS